MEDGSGWEQTVSKDKAYPPHISNYLLSIYF